MSLRATGIDQLLPGLCVDCSVSAVDGDDVVAAVTFASTTVAKQSAEGWIEKKLFKGPVKTLYEAISISSKETPEEQAEEAYNVYFDMIMFSDAPEGSTANDLEKAKNRMVEFIKGDIRIGPEDDDRIGPDDND
jgi:hypothetical protein